MIPSHRLNLQPNLFSILASFFKMNLRWKINIIPGGLMWFGGILERSVGSKLWLRVRSRLLGRSLTRRLSCRLKGDAWFSWLKPRKEPWRSSIEGVACGLSIAKGLNTCLTGGASGEKRRKVVIDIVEGYENNSMTQGCCVLYNLPMARSRVSCNRSVRLGCLKLPLLVKDDVFESNVIVTPHAVSLRCLRSRHAANAHPTAWLNRSPWKFWTKKSLKKICKVNYAKRINFDVPEVLNVHVNETNKKINFFRRIFFFKQWKIKFWERKSDFLKYFLKF